MGIATRYSSIYVLTFCTLMATTSGLCRTRNPCPSSWYQLFLVDNNHFFFAALRIRLGEPPRWRQLARNVRYHSGTRPRQGFWWAHKLCNLGELITQGFLFLFLFLFFFFSRRLFDPISGRVGSMEYGWLRTQTAFSFPTLIILNLLNCIICSICGTAGFKRLNTTFFFDIHPEFY